MVNAAGFAKRLRTLAGSVNCGEEVTPESVGVLIEGTSLSLTDGVVRIIRRAVDLAKSGGQNGNGSGPSHLQLQSVRGPTFYVKLASATYRMASDAADRDWRASQPVESPRPDVIDFNEPYFPI